MNVRTDQKGTTREGQEEECGKNEKYNEGIVVLKVMDIEVE